MSLILLYVVVSCTIWSFICKEIDNDNILKMLGQEAQQDVEQTNLVNGISWMRSMH